MKKAEHPTPNIQHPTSNEEARKRRFDLEERMLDHAARIVELYDSLPSGTGAKQVGNQLIHETHQLIRIFFASTRTARSRGEESYRVREDAPGARDEWMLSVGCWMLDVSTVEEAP